MEKKGKVEDIIYQNELNSYTIAVFAAEEEETTVVRISTICKKRRYTKTNRKLCRTQRIWKTI